MASEPRLARHEIALVKAMLARGDFPKDRIQAYFSRPDRTVNYGRIHDVGSGKIGSDVEPADDQELVTFLSSFGVPQYPEVSAENDPLSQAALSLILRVNRKRLNCLLKDENDLFEAKETFHPSGGQFAKYAKTAAGFANSGGGYIVFGVKNDSLELVGLADQRFLKTDKAELAQRFDKYLAPSIHWDRTTCDISGKRLGVLYIYSSLRKPIVSRYEADGLRDGAVYFRYIGETREARSAELEEILSARDRRAADELAKLVTRVSSIGAQNVGLLDIDSGTVEGPRGAFVIDENILPKLNFIREGDFALKKGAPTLRLIGDVEPVERARIKPIIVSGRAISEHDIVRDFVQQVIQFEPREYIRIQLHLQYKILPIFFFAWKAQIGSEEVISMIMAERDVSTHTREKVIQRASGERRVNIESRRYLADMIDKMLSSEPIRVTPENAIRVARAARALTAEEVHNIDIFRILRVLLAVHDEKPDHALYSQIRLTASYIDEVIFGAEPG